MSAPVEAFSSVTLFPAPLATQTSVPSEEMASGSSNP